MLVTPEGLVWSVDDRGTAAICFKRPHECPRCHRMIFFAVNRMGKTLCTSCDDETKKDRP